LELIYVFDLLDDSLAEVGALNRLASGVTVGVEPVHPINAAALHIQMPPPQSTNHPDYPLTIASG
jgi:hypothetical protein